MKTIFKNVKATVEITGQEVAGNLQYEEVEICGGLLVETKYNLIFRSNERIRKFAGFSKVTLDNGYEFIGYCGVYTLIARDNLLLTLQMQCGPRKEKDSLHGVIDTDLLEIVRDRLKAFQAGPFSSRENACALTHIEEALMWMNRRVEDRIERNVLGKNKK